MLHLGWSHCNLKVLLLRHLKIFNTNKSFDEIVRQYCYCCFVALTNKYLWPRKLFWGHFRQRQLCLHFLKHLSAFHTKDGQSAQWFVFDFVFIVVHRTVSQCQVWIIQFLGCLKSCENSQLFSWNIQYFYCYCIWRRRAILDVRI